LCGYGCKELEVKGIEAVKQTNGLEELAGTGGNVEDGIDPFGDAQGENSRPMVA
jgi:hypothetical protein